MFKVSKVTLEQGPDVSCSDVILPTLNMFLFAGVVTYIVYENNMHYIRQCIKIV